MVNQHLGNQSQSGATKYAWRTF